MSHLGDLLAVQLLVHLQGRLGAEAAAAHQVTQDLGIWTGGGRGGVRVGGWEGNGKGEEGG